VYQTYIISLGCQWKKDTREFIATSLWPTAIVSDPSPSDVVSETDNDSLDLDDFSPLPESMLELDDRHVAFLEGQDTVERDEVERILSLADYI
jgi:hypothetical protein